MGTQSYGGTPARIGKTTGTFNTPAKQKRPIPMAPKRMPMHRKRG